MALTEAQQRAGLVSQAEVDDLQAHAGDIDLAAALAIERKIGHDLMAEIRVYTSRPTVGCHWLVPDPARSGLVPPGMVGSPIQFAPSKLERR